MRPHENPVPAAKIGHDQKTRTCATCSESPAKGPALVPCDPWMSATAAVMTFPKHAAFIISNLRATKDRKDPLCTRRCIRLLRPTKSKSRPPGTKPAEAPGLTGCEPEYPFEILKKGPLKSVNVKAGVLTRRIRSAAVDRRRCGFQRRSNYLVLHLWRTSARYRTAARHAAAGWTPCPPQ